MPALYTKRPDNTVGSIPHDIVITYPYDAAANILDNWVFVADTDYEITRIVCVPRVVGSDGSAVTADILKASGTTDADGGTTVLSAADSFDLKATVDTLQVGTLSATQSAIRLTTNDRLSVNFGGTMTAAVGLIQINLKRLQSANNVY